MKDSLELRGTQQQFSHAVVKLLHQLYTSVHTLML